MSTDFDKGMRPNLYELMVGGGGGEIPPATRETLGGVIIGPGVNVDEDGTISVTAPAPEDTYTKAETDALLAERDGRINNLDRNLAEYEDEIDAQQDAQDAAIGTNAANIATLQNDVDALENGTYTKAEIDAQQATQNTAISANASSILTLISDVSTLNAGQDAQDAAIEANAANIATLQSDVDALEAGTYTKSEIDAQQSAQDTAINANASSILTLQNDVDALEAGTYTKSEIDAQQSAQDTAIDDNAAAIAGLAAQIASDLVLGLVRTDSAKNISVDQDGVLQIGGRLGQFSSEEMPDGGLYYPLSIEPEVVWKNSLLITEGTLVSTRSSRIFALAAGTNVNLKTAAAAGATRFEVSNTFANRFSCAVARNGYATIQEGTAGTIMVHVTNVYLANDPDKTPLVPYSGATESGNNIVIETDAPLSDTDTVSRLRLYGTMTFDSSFHCGQGNGTGGVTGKGKILQLGQNILSLEGNSIFVGNGIFSSKNRVCIVGANHINHVQGACLTGEGHDTTDGAFVGIAEHGKYSLTKANTTFAIGNGTSNTARSNLFEIADENGTTAIMVKSPNGTEFKISVDDNGQLITTQV